MTRSLTLAVSTTASVLAVAGLTIAPAMHAADRPSSTVEWRTVYGDVQGTKSSTLDQIDTRNVQRLELAWRVPTPDRDIQLSNILWRMQRYEDTPLMANGTLYTMTGISVVAALDPSTGAVRWRFDPEAYKAGRPANMGFVQRGLAYWTDGKAERLLVSSTDGYLLSVDAATGKLDPAFGNGGRVNVAAGIRDAVAPRNYSPRRPLIAGDIAVVGSSIDDMPTQKRAPPGDVQAYDVRTGTRLWVFHTIPQAGEVGAETWLDGSGAYSGAANVWAGMTYDPELGYIYLPTGSATADYYGDNRPGNNLFAESLVCLEAKTGKRVWHFQTVHHGLWDYDLPAQPVLGDIKVDGRTIKAVMQVTKTGFTFVFDRATGTPVWPIEERPVPGPTSPLLRASPTQPFPLKPPPFELQGATEDNLLDFTPELRARAADRLKQYQYGPLFTPPTLKGTVTVPGVFGGANWGGAGFDSATGILYVASTMNPFIIGLTPSDPQKSDIAYRVEFGSVDLDGLPLFKPPYSRITAIDMNKGEHAWVAPLGDGPKNHPLLKGLTLPPLGDLAAGAPASGVLVTKTLVFVNKSRGSGGVSAGDATTPHTVLYAFDKASGHMLREIQVKGVESVAAPMTYFYKGKQFIVVAAGSGATAELLAFSLPMVP